MNRRSALTAAFLAFVASTSMRASAADASVEKAPDTPRRYGWQIASRLVCLDAVQTPGYCMGGLQLGWVFPYGDVHIGVMGSAGQNTAVFSGDGYTVNPYLAPFAGLELGTRYYTMPLNQHGLLVDLGIAARGQAEFIGMFTPSQPSQYQRDFAFANTYGPHFILTIGSRVALTLRSGIGWAVRKPTYATPGNPTDPVYGLAVDALLAALVRF